MFFFKNLCFFQIPSFGELYHILMTCLHVPVLFAIVAL